MQWKWKEGRILNSYNQRTPCKDIFKAAFAQYIQYYFPDKYKDFQKMES